MSRSARMFNFLLKAGVRLAQIIDVVAARYMDAKRNARPAHDPSEASEPAESQPEPLSTNPFEVLFEFDPEAYLTPLEDTHWEGVSTRSGASLKNPLDEKQQNKLDDAVIDEFRSTDDLFTINGVYLKAIVLVKFRNQYWLTYSSQKSRLWQSDGAKIVARFANSSEPREFFVDTGALYPAKVTVEVVRAMLLFLKGEYVPGRPTESLVSIVPLGLQWFYNVFERIGPEFLPSCKAFVAFSSSRPDQGNIERTPSAAEKALKSLNLVGLFFGGAGIITTPEFAKKLSPPGGVRLNVLPLRGDGRDFEGMLLMIDARVFPHPITSFVVDLASDLSRQVPVRKRLGDIFDSRAFDLNHMFEEMVNHRISFAEAQKRHTVVKAIEPVETTSEVFMINVLMGSRTRRWHK